MSEAFLDPISCIEWLHCGLLKANHYNPNVVFNQELKLLEHSLFKTGWVQPILISPERNIIDGFHRWALMQESKRLRERYAGRLPCATIKCSEPEAMMLTIRMNRAKGTHVAVRMSDIVQTLMNVYGLSHAAIMEGIGATRDEVDLLYQDSIFEAKGLANYRYSRAWIPKETRPMTPGGMKKVERG
jgi:hypothetical protein